MQENYRKIRKTYSPEKTNTLHYPTHTQKKQFNENKISHYIVHVIVAERYIWVEQNKSEVECDTQQRARRKTKLFVNICL